MNILITLNRLVLLIAIASSTCTFAVEQGLPSTFLPAERISQGELPPLDGATQWLNSTPLTAKGLSGKVVVVNFWTYSCINSLRQIPYVRAWAKKYGQQGLVVIGVHAPEFGFERDIENVRRGVQQAGVDYPVAIDNDHRIWQAFGNNAWPALYFIDAQGHIRYEKIGEGEYEDSERVIQQLLTEARAHQISAEFVTAAGEGSEAAADWDNLRSPETYVGFDRAERFVSPSGAVPDRQQRYVIPDQVALNHWALSGDWNIGGEAAVALQANGKIVYRFHARDLNLVMRPSPSGSAVRIRVTLDGKPPGSAHGTDVDSDGNGTVNRAQMYQLIRQLPSISDKEIEIEFLDPGVEIFAFTFG